MTAVHKANIIKTSSGLFLDVAREVASEYPEIEFQEMIVDNACMQLVMNPHQFDVVVTTNLFGDILSDLGPGVTGTIAVAPSANINPDREFPSMFEPVHGSAPDIAGKGIANPLATISAVAMMLDYLGEIDAAGKVDDAVARCLNERKVLTPDLGGSATTSQVADEVIRLLADR